MSNNIDEFDFDEEFKKWAKRTIKWDVFVPTRKNQAIAFILFLEYLQENWMDKPREKRVRTDKYANLNLTDDQRFLLSANLDYIARILGISERKAFGKRAVALKAYETAYFNQYGMMPKPFKWMEGQQARIKRLMSEGQSLEEAQWNAYMMRRTDCMQRQAKFRESKRIKKKIRENINSKK